MLLSGVSSCSCSRSLSIVRTAVSLGTQQCTVSLCGIKSASRVSRRISSPWSAGQQGKVHPDVFSENRYLEYATLVG